MSAIYTIQLVAHVELVSGDEPDWRDVAEATATALAGESISVGGGRLVVDDVEVDEAEELEP